MNPSTPLPIGRNTELVVSSASPHLYAVPHFPANDPKYPLCNAQPQSVPEFERLTRCEAVTAEMVRVGNEEKYVDAAISCAECCTAYQARFQA